jgi:1-acyl-sn-glycerol-3-phosphate acyltransferase
MSQNQFSLLTKKRFLPFFITQALGAFNDNIFKNSLMLLLAFSAASQLPFDTNLLMNVAAGLFILPFLLFSGIAGRIADKYDMDKIIRITKIAEIIIMSFAVFALYFEAYLTLIFILFLMGTQSAFFGPVKYAILPKSLHKDELVGGNALIEMGTFVSILFGTILGGILVGFEQASFWISVSILLFAILGFLTSRYIPVSQANNSTLEISWNIFSQTFTTFKVAQKYRDVLLSMMAISWFWFMGASYLTQIPNYTKTTLIGNNEVVTLLLAVFSIGIATGSLICEKLSNGKIEIGIVPIGSIGLSIFGIDLFLNTPNFSVSELMGLSEFIKQNGALGILFDFAAIGFFGGLYSVPLMALVQQRSDKNEKAQTIAANNILNALFMVASAISGILMLSVAKLSIPEYFLVVSIMNIVVVVYIYSQVPEFLLRFVIYFISHTMYRVKHQGFENIPDEGAAVVVCNHVSYMDALILAGACKRPMRFVIDKEIFNKPALNWFFRLAKTISIASQKSDPDMYQTALKRVSEELKNGQVVCIFPEGKLTKDGEVDTFRKGIEAIIKTDPVPVIPMALQGLWGSFFSHKDGTALSTLPYRFWSRVNIIVSEAWAPEQANAQALEEKVKELRGSSA